MFKDYIKEHINYFIENNDEEYNISEKDIEHIATMIEHNDYLWETIDSMICDELSEYEIID